MHGQWASCQPAKIEFLLHPSVRVGLTLGSSYQHIGLSEKWCCGNGRMVKFFLWAFNQKSCLDFCRKFQNRKSLISSWIISVRIHIIYQNVCHNIPHWLIESNCNYYNYNLSEIWNFVKILLKLWTWPTFVLCCNVNISYNVL